jgi:hypothetical protein|tara:strand:+ start:155 stop:265 length:111 start_codon:yes stop_codon:yes gene_type:complete
LLLVVEVVLTLTLLLAVEQVDIEHLLKLYQVEMQLL